MKYFKTIICLTALCLLSLSAFAERIEAPKAQPEKYQGQIMTLEKMGEKIKFADLFSSLSTETPLDAGSRQGGEDISSATIIGSLPYLDTGTTAGYVDNYDASCNNTSTSPDVVYSYTPASGERVRIWSCDSDYWTKMFIYTASDTINEIACNQYNDSCTVDPYHAAILDLDLTGGETYYIVMDGFGGQSGQYVLYMEAMPPIDTLNLHPAIAHNGGTDMLLGYEYYEYSSNIYWYLSQDSGVNFFGGVGWNLSGGMPTYPSADYWNSDTAFKATFVVPSEYYNGAPNFLATLEAGQPADNLEGSFWNWSSYGWHDMKMADIACADWDSTWSWGIISMIHSTTYTSPAMVDAPHIFYPANGEGSANISWFSGLDNCSTTTCDVDRTTIKAYAMYDHYDDSLGLWELFGRQDDLTDMDETVFAGGWTLPMDDSTNVMYPSVAADNGYLLTVAENWDPLDPTDHDIVCLYTQTGSIGDLNNGIVVATADDERFPRIQHLDSTFFVCTYLKDNAVYAVITEDAGVTWGTPEMISAVGDSVVMEYRAVDIAEAYNYATMIVYEYMIPGGTEKGAGSTWLRMIPYTPYPDTDGDGVIDILDNCPEDYNPLQEDTNDNGVGDACDYICGDINEDGNVNILDITETICILYQDCPSPTNPIPGDVNDDGLLNILDITYLIAYLYQGGPAPHCS